MTPPAAPEAYEGERKVGYWKANLTVIVVLLSIWALVGLVLPILLAEPLNEIQFFELPLGFWFAHQGAILVFVILIFVYAFWMDRIDKKFDVHE